MSDFPLTVTAATTLILGVVYLFLTFVVIRHRRADKVAIGDNDDKVLAKKIRGHANAAEQIPMGLIIIGLNEAMNSAPTAMFLAALLVIGRILHAIHYTRKGTPLSFRAFGMMLTLLSQILGLVGLFLGLIL